jgi:hypothetical protein
MLNMALQIKDELGTSYSDLRRIEPSNDAKIQSIVFQNTGGNTNVAFGQASVNASTNMEIVINIGDKQKLDQVLSAAGFEQADLERLTDAIQADGGKKPGSKVGTWIKENASKVVTGGAKIGARVGAEILTAWLKQYYGL